MLVEYCPHRQRVSYMKIRQERIRHKLPLMGPVLKGLEQEIFALFSFDSLQPLVLPMKYLAFCRDFAEIFVNFDSLSKYDTAGKGAVSIYHSLESEHFPGTIARKVSTFHVPLPVK